MTLFSSPPLLLGLDAGGSGTQWSLRRGDQTVASGTASPLTAALLDLPAGAQALAELRAALPEPPAALHAGLPGLSAGSVRAAQVQQRLAHALGLSPDRISVEGDLDLAYRAHLQPGAGVLVYAGTGSIAYHVGALGETLRAGGRGYRLGAEGGGANLGREALRRITDALDLGVRPTGPLADEIAAVTGGVDWDTLRAFVYGPPGASALARLAPAVARAAEAGDPAAQAIQTGAAQALADLAQRVQTQLQAHGAAPLPVVATGGALRSPGLAAEMRRACPGVTIQWRDHAAVAAEYAARLLHSD
jgi:N-acetylglucosamine kinase-like BadF-type ATPase